MDLKYHHLLIVLKCIKFQPNLSALTQRSVTPELRHRILDKIARKKIEGKHTIYPIAEADFKKWNPKV